MKVYKIQFIVSDPNTELITEYIVAAKNETEALMILGNEDPLDYLHRIYESEKAPETHIDEIEYLDYKGVYPTVLYHFFEWVK